MAGLDANTKLLLHLNGADGATSTTDASPSGHTITFVDAAQLDTAQKKWGNASLLLDGDGDNLSALDSSDWDIFGSNSDDWTIDLWVKHADHASIEGYVGQYEGENDFWYLGHDDTGGGIYLRVKSGGVDNVISVSQGGEIEDTNWHHVALCKVADEYGIYKGGTQVGYAQDSSTATNAGTLRIGLAGSPYYFEGHVDEIRIQHSNYFGAAPNATPDDTITVPTRQYGLLAQAIFME